MPHNICDGYGLAPQTAKRIPAKIVKRFDEVIYSKHKNNPILWL